MQAQQARVETDRVHEERRPPSGNGALRDKPINQLVRELSQDTAMLVRQETELFKTEMNAHVDEVKRTAGVLGVGASIAWFGCMALTAAIILGLAQVMDGWVAALIVGVAYLAAGGIALALGKKRLAEQEMRPEQTTSSIQKDIRAVREAAR